MKAITFDRFGDAGVLQLTDVAAPEPRPTDLLIRVHAAGVNRADLTHRRGGYGRPNFGDSTIMGLEIAGEVIAVGADAQGYAVGDRVMGIVGGGAYAQVARMDYRMALPIPDALDYVHAAAIPEVFVTAHEALIHLGGLKAGESVLVHAAAGGVGSAAVQLAHASGARVFATAEGRKLDAVAALGADVCIDYTAADFVRAVADATDGQGVNLVVDFIGAPYFERNLDALAEGGRLVQVGILGGADGARMPLDKLLYRYLRIIGTVMKSRPQHEKHAMVRRFRAHWLDNVETARFKPVVDSTFPLARAADAHRRMESSENVGKIILTMD